MKLFMFSMLFGMAIILSSTTTNFSGKWVIEPTGRGQRQPIFLLLNQVGSEVTGTLSARIDVGTGSPANDEIFEGKVEGDTLTFYVWTGLDRPIKAFYKGALSGDEIKFTVTGGVVPPVGLAGPGANPEQAKPQQITAKRTKLEK